MCFQCIITTEFIILLFIFAGDVWPDHLVKGLSVWLLYSKVKIFPLVLNKYLVGDILILSFAWMSWNSLCMELVVLLRDLTELHLMIMKWISLRDLSPSRVLVPYSWFHQRTLRFCRSKSLLVFTGVNHTCIPFILKSPVLISCMSLNPLHPTVC